MSKALKWSTTALVVVAIGVVLGHGIIIPRFIWEPRLHAIQNQYPDQQISAKRVVLALSLNPQLMISEIEINDPARQENVKTGLIKFGISAVDSIRQGRLQVNSVTLKGLEVRAEKNADCSTLNRDCLAVLPMALAARTWQSTQVANPAFYTPELALDAIEIEQAVFAISNSQAGQLLTSKLEQFKFQLGNTNTDRPFSLGWRINIQTPETNNELYIAMSAQTAPGPVREIALKKLKVDISGQWDGFPWTGNAEQDLLVLRVLRTNEGEGLPILKLNGENLRTYIRRDDLPETHQAAFSVQQLEGGLPAQDWQLKKAEWTYTHEDAQAWTFNVNYNAENALLSITPETIEGSEGLPAEPQLRELNCAADEPAGEAAKTYWAWQEGWFRVLAQHPRENPRLILCPAQQPSAGFDLLGADESPSGKTKGK